MLFLYFEQLFSSLSNYEKNVVEYIKKGDFQKTKEYAKSAVDVLEKSEGLFAISIDLEEKYYFFMSMLAVSNHKLGNSLVAEQLLLLIINKQNSSAQRSVLPLIESMSYLGNVYLDQKKYVPAESIFIELLEEIEEKKTQKIDPYFNRVLRYIETIHNTWNLTSQDFPKIPNGEFRRSKIKRWLEEARQDPSFKLIR